jgi:hypothetical protein
MAVLLWIHNGLQAQTVTQVLSVDQKSMFGEELYQVVYDTTTGNLIGMTRSGVIALGGDGKQVSEMSLLPGQRAVLSSEGRFVNTMTHAREYVSYYALMNLEGEILFELKPPGTFVGFYSGRDAQFVVGIEVQAYPLQQKVPTVFHFYNREGRELATAETVNPTGYALSTDGKAFAANTQADGLVVFGHDGRQLWTSEKQYTMFALSDGGQFAVAKNRENLKQFDLIQDGRVIAQARLDLPVFNLAISPDAKQLIATDMHTLKIFDSNLQQLGERKYGDNVFINSVSIDKGKKSVAGMIITEGSDVEKQIRAALAEVALLAQDGTVVWSARYDIELTNAWIPEVQLVDISERNSILIVRTREKVFLYRIQE